MTSAIVKRGVRLGDTWSPNSGLGVRMRRRGCRSIATVVVALGIAGCGGGGGGASPPPAPPAPPVVAPSVQTHPVSVTVNAGGPASFAVTALGTAPLSYQWRRNGSDIANATQATLQIAAVTIADNGAAYAVMVSNSAGSAVSNAATLTVNPPAPPAIVTQPVGATVIVDGSATFTVAASGGPLQYQWRINGLTVTDGALSGGPCIGGIAVGAQSSTFTLSKTPLGCSGAQITAAVSNTAGPTISSAATLFVRLVSAFGPVCTGASQSGWCWVNPLPQSARITAVSFAGNTGIAVGHQETIYRTADAGLTWSAVHHGADFTRLHDVASASAMVRVTVGDSILRSTDGGVSWSKVYGPGADLLGVGFATSSVGFAVSPSNSTLRTLDGGATWAPHGPRGRGIAFRSATEGIIVGDGLIWRTVDGGSSWVSSPTPSSLFTLWSVAYVNDSTVVTVGDGGFARSTDGGTTWTALQTGPDRILRRVAFLPGTNTGIATGTDRIWQTTDGGQFWGQVLSVSGTMYGVGVVDDRTAIAVGDAGYVLRTTTAGAGWTQISYRAGSNVRHYNAVASRPGLALAVGSQGIVRSGDGGDAWTPVFTGNNDQLRGVAISANGTTALAVGDTGTILRSVDGGVTWSSTPSGSVNPLFGVTFVSDTVAVVAGGGGTILRSADSGSTWTSVTSGALQNLLAVAFADASVGVAVGTAGTAVRTTDSGITWTPVATGVQVFLAGVAFATPSVGVAVGGGGQVIRTTDGGQSWNQVPSATTSHLSGVAFAGPATVFATISFPEGAAIVSNNAGASWSSAQWLGSYPFAAVSFQSPTVGFIVGERDAILRTTTAGQ